MPVTELPVYFLSSIVKGEDVAVVGGASAAVSGAITMLDYTGTAQLICDQLDVTDAFKEQLKDSNVIVHENAKVKEIQKE